MTTCQPYLIQLLKGKTTWQILISLHSKLLTAPKVNYLKNQLKQLNYMSRLIAAMGHGFKANFATNATMKQMVFAVYWPKPFFMTSLTQITRTNGDTWMESQLALRLSKRKKMIDLRFGTVHAIRFLKKENSKSAYH